ncbi:lycopene cyclase domain-containing protein [Leucobacter japonicus]|uniref:lycopene cyclase domain-containing protein n=1 Tax=Leucobacter japonicus TaxID=1461259 RepID=UPI0006A791FD|nr:lycopene cyclase domain-containing protein [Leucobacter japonicus]
MALLYLGSLLVTIGCMLLLDWRFRLFFWSDWRAAALVLVLGVGFLLAWDLWGIASGVFRLGESRGMTGLLIAHELPIEEPVFLAFLVLCTMVAFTGALRLLDVRGGRARRRHEPQAPGSDGDSDRDPEKYGDA